MMMMMVMMNMVFWFFMFFLNLRIIKSVLLLCQKIPRKIKTNIDDVENLLFVVLFRKPWVFPHHVVCLPIWVKIITQHHPPDVLPWLVQLLRLYAASRGLPEPSAAHSRWAGAFRMSSGGRCQVASWKKGCTKKWCVYITILRIMTMWFTVIVIRIHDKANRC